MTPSFEFIGGDVSLDLVNTLMHRGHPAGADDLLQTGHDVRRWFQEAGVVSAREADALDAESALYGARRLRTALDQLYRPLSRRDAPATSTGLDTLNAVLAQGRERTEVSLTPQGFARSTRLEVLGPIDPSVQVAHAAAALLGRLQPARLKECENPDCDLLFYDESRNASRRWCAMQSCGNVTKQARHRSSRRARQAPGAQVEANQRDS
ncbi:CGNR zinc finger domain-containing protein [Deinococcus koreensis]|uniref:Zinc finger CGNR domain-containing protein n=1 Tax=Deinococcus koreensis TaxID=2054903 RepID=A0A2K3UT82_9DEIO|nr:CGNR zinc finger domain-containing protein [Deinococcus koreensis]PNY79741.1 hypothetical protein CVO96_17460 [Deinococcus koreensis]